MTSAKPWGKSTVKHKAIKIAEDDERKRIAHAHRQLRVDFLARDAVRFPGGWRLPETE